MRHSLTIAYDGTKYSGWQVQSNALSIQALIQSALAVALRHPVDLTGSGRTDAGVHARGQIAHFDTDVIFHPKSLLISINALLPPDIRILSVEERELSFHARYSAKSKTYHYHLHLDPVTDPILAPYRFHVPERLCRTKLMRGTKYFLGERDFTSFANQAYRGSASRDPIRTLLRFDALEQDGGIRLELEATGFLYKMARNIVGTLLDYAKGKVTSEQIEQIFQSKDRKKAGSAAPPHGLFLMQVAY
jgi:tRNA pseudouridine38-40 synthase